MKTPDSSSLAQILLLAPGWARIGLTAPNQRLREQAAAELAESIIDALARPQAILDDRQMPLPL
ncbi:DUF6771 family protein [Sphingomonas sp. 3-13AW]|uniref:DUF6771 family protein n=1 Tax=Sphingomonas sp. 3-13AW TaxID=3050450 RepID=UPI003BB74735